EQPARLRVEDDVADVDEAADRGDDAQRDLEELLHRAAERSPALAAYARRRRATCAPVASSPGMTWRSPSALDTCCASITACALIRATAPRACASASFSASWSMSSARSRACTRTNVERVR